jgi:ankyrin repeat protein
VQSLLKANADAALKNGLGNTPLHWAALNGHKTVTPDQA